MADQCDNCDYMRIRTYGTNQVMECRVQEPVTQGQLGKWPQVQGEDWCGEYDPIGWTDPSNLIINGVTLNTVTKTKVIEATVSGYILWVISSNVTNTSINKGMLIKFYDGNTTTIIGVISVQASQSTGGLIAPPLRAISGQVWAQLDTTDGSDVYVYLQGKQVAPVVAHLAEGS